MKKIIIATLVAVAMVGTASARHHHRGDAIAGGIAGGIAAGLTTAILGAPPPPPPPPPPVEAGMSSHTA